MDGGTVTRIEMIADLEVLEEMRVESLRLDRAERAARRDANRPSDGACRSAGASDGTNASGA
jgi:hypothetical protein